tara:strand:- start:3147 stop:4010 length:864 start_codon:yes stop_codon:yes gene_type:complete
VGDEVDFLNGEFDQFKKRIGNLHFRQLLLKHEAQEKRRSTTWVEGKWAPVYRNPYDGKKEKYSAHAIEGESEYRAILSEQQNAMYRWLIVDCYEIFDKYLKALQRFILVGDGRRSGGSATRLCEECGRKLGRRSRFDKLVASLNQDADFKSLLRKSHIDIELDVAVLVLSEFRNIIVHEAGRLSNLDTFVDKVMYKAGWEGADKRADVYNFACGFVTTKNSPLLPESLSFLERSFPGSRVPGHHFDLYQELSGCFVGYAELVRDCVLGRLGCEGGSTVKREGARRHK